MESDSQLWLDWLKPCWADTWLFFFLAGQFASECFPLAWPVPVCSSAAPVRLPGGQDAWSWAVGLHLYPEGMDGPDGRCSRGGTWTESDRMWRMELDEQSLRSEAVAQGQGAPKW